MTMFSVFLTNSGHCLMPILYLDFFSILGKNLFVWIYLCAKDKQKNCGLKAQSVPSRFVSNNENTKMPRNFMVFL